MADVKVYLIDITAYCSNKSCLCCKVQYFLIAGMGLLNWSNHVSLLRRNLDAVVFICRKYSNYVLQ